MPNVAISGRRRRSSGAQRNVLDCLVITRQKTQQLKQRTRFANYSLNCDLHKSDSRKNTNLNSPRIYNEVTTIRKKPDFQNHLNPPSATFSTKRVAGLKYNWHLQHFNGNQKLIPMLALRLQIIFYQKRLATNQPSWRLSYLKHWMLFTYNVVVTGRRRRSRERSERWLTTLL